MTSTQADPSGPVKVFVFLKRKPGMSVADFRDHWENHHARYFADTPEIRRHVRRYEIHHRVDDPGRDRSEVEVDDGGYDGVAIMWFDSAAELQAMQDEPGFAEFSAADVERYRAPEMAMVVTRVGDVIVPSAGGGGDAGMSLICILRHHPDLSLAEFHDHWLHHHGALFQDIDELRDPLLGYEQNHGVDTPGAEYDGVTQQWFESLDAWVKSLEAPAHHDVVEPDIASFLDLGSIAFVLAGRPTVVIDG
jgi:hypothetical protein